MHSCCAPTSTSSPCKTRLSEVLAFTRCSHAARPRAHPAPADMFNVFRLNKMHQCTRPPAHPAPCSHMETTCQKSILCWSMRADKRPQSLFGNLHALGSQAHPGPVELQGRQLPVAPGRQARQREAHACAAHEPWYSLALAWGQSGLWRQRKGHKRGTCTATCLSEHGWQPHPSSL